MIFDANFSLDIVGHNTLCKCHAKATHMLEGHVMQKKDLELAIVVAPSTLLASRVLPNNTSIC
jgi:hypothetical protein